MVVVCSGNMRLNRTGKMKMTGSARSNSCLAMIPKADCLAQTSSVISLATHN